ncbi:hypothetical protein JKP88DRAFT_261391 [Tribonema minus]|uniref:Cyclin N-terminal domain-containing protein n=1 Tax=Tribonema minus TaxID=303371 RepID=A0A835YPH7_9STRA|nr:hypothetical protein JKP88DRAFT_261391 [Tribonema minus]
MDDARSQKEKDEEVLAYLSGGNTESEAVTPPFYEANESVFNRSLSTDNLSRDDLIWERPRDSLARSGRLPSNKPDDDAAFAATAPLPRPLSTRAAAAALFDERLASSDDDAGAALTTADAVGDVRADAAAAAAAAPPQQQAPAAAAAEPSNFERSTPPQFKGVDSGPEVQSSCAAPQRGCAARCGSISPHAELRSAAQRRLPAQRLVAIRSKHSCHCGRGSRRMLVAENPSNLRSPPLRQISTLAPHQLPAAPPPLPPRAPAQPPAGGAAAADAAAAAAAAAAAPEAAARSMAYGSVPAKRRRIYPVGRGQARQRWATREIAALAFLSSIPMRQEAKIIEHGTRAAQHSPGSAGRGAPLSDADGGATGTGIGTGDGEEDGATGHARVREPADEDEASLSDADEAGEAEGKSKGQRGGSSPGPGRRLGGPEATHVRVPRAFRHGLLQLPGQDAAEVRQWERSLANQGLLDGRLFFSGTKGYPLAVCSVIRYEPKEEELRRRWHKLVDERGAEAFRVPRRDWRGFSYGYLLSAARPEKFKEPNHMRSRVQEQEAPQHQTLLHLEGSAHVPDDEPRRPGRPGTEQEAPQHQLLRHLEGGAHVPDYEPGVLDDPALSVGRHKQLLTGDEHTGPVICSVLQYVKPKDLKEDLNRQFRDRHPDLPPSLTLSKIRSIKRQALAGCHRIGVEATLLQVASVALACVYFERLCLMALVTKANRRLAMAACLLLAYKSWVMALVTKANRRLAMAACVLVAYKKDYAFQFKMREQFNEPLSISGYNSKLPGLWSFIDSEWQVSKKQVLEAEFGVLVQLGFCLHEDPRHVSYHFTRLLKMVETNAREYLGESMLGMHQRAVAMFSDDGEDGVDGLFGGGGGGGGGDGSQERGPKDRAATMATDTMHGLQHHECGARLRAMRCMRASEFAHSGCGHHGDAAQASGVPRRGLRVNSAALSTGRHTRSARSSAMDCGGGLHVAPADSVQAWRGTSALRR